MLQLEIILVLIILMFLVSFLYSNLGLGGGMLYVPIMVFVATTMDRLEIIPVSLFLSFMTQLPAAYTHHKRAFVKVRVGIILGLATIPGVVIGVLIGIRSTDILAYCLFSILLFITGIKMLFDIYKKKFEQVTDDMDFSKQLFISVMVISIGTGIVSAFFGVGGGIITVPVLIYLLGIYTRRAIGTSALMIVITSMVGFICYSLLAFNVLDLPGVALRDIPPIPYDLAIILGLVTLVGAYLGSSWGLKSLKTKNIQVIFVIIIFIVGVQLFLRALGYL